MRSLAVVLDAVAIDLENAGIPAETTREVATSYRQSALQAEIREDSARG